MSGFRTQSTAPGGISTHAREGRIILTGDSTTMSGITGRVPGGVSFTDLLRNLFLNNLSRGLVGDVPCTERSDPLLSCRSPAGGRTGAGKSSRGRGPRGDPTCLFTTRGPRASSCQLRLVEEYFWLDVRPLLRMIAPTWPVGVCLSTTERRQGQTARSSSTPWTVAT